MEMRAQLVAAGPRLRPRRNAGDRSRRSARRRSFTGTVWQVAPVIDPQSRLGEVRIAVPYDPAMQPGGFAEAQITAGTTTAPLLPQSAVLSDDKGNYVYIVNAQERGRAARRSQIGTVDDSGVTIAAGLSGNEARRAVGRSVPQPGPEGEPEA